MRVSIAEKVLRKTVPGFAKEPMDPAELLRNLKYLSTCQASPATKPWRTAAPASLIPPTHGRSDPYVPGTLSKVGQLSRAIVAAIRPLMGGKLNRMVSRGHLLDALRELLRRDYAGWFDGTDAYDDMMSEAFDRVTCLPLRFKDCERTSKKIHATRPIICVTRTGSSVSYALVLDCLPYFLTKLDYESARKLHKTLKPAHALNFRFVESAEHRAEAVFTCLPGVSAADSRNYKCL